MMQSLMTWNGFYIGRYEASQKNSTVAQSKRENSVWTGITQENAITYSANSSITNMHLIRGIEWDYVLKWLIGNAKITSSNTILTEEQVQTDSTAWGNYPNSTNAGSNSSSVQTTGYSEYWKANNIYDLAGNVYEWTQEYYLNEWNVVMNTARGGAAEYRT